VLRLRAENCSLIERIWRDDLMLKVRKSNEAGFKAQRDYLAGLGADPKGAGFKPARKYSKTAVRNRGYG